MPVRPSERQLSAAHVPNWLLGAALALGLVTIFAYVRTLPQLALAEEDYHWQGVFRALWESGQCSALFGRATGTYRPLCGAFLLIQDGVGLGPTAKFATSALLHVVNLVALGTLVSRVLGWRVGTLAALIALCWSSADEVVLSLGARCDLLSMSCALLASHAALAALRSPRGGYLLALFAAVAAGCAALVKEPAFALPFLWLIYAHATRAARWRCLLPAVVVALVLLGIRTVVSRGLGSYVDYYIDRGLFAFAANTVKALGALVLGSGPNAGPLLSILAALVAMTGLSGLITRSIFAGVRLHALLAIALLLGPIGLLFAVRTMYPLVLLFGVLVAVAVADGKRAGHALVVLGLAYQVWSGGVGLRRWERAYAGRASAIAEVVGALPPGERGLLVLPRTKFSGVALGAVCTADLPDAREVARLCMPGVNVDPSLTRLVRMPAANEETGSATYKIAVTRDGPCDFRFRSPLALSCLDTRSDWVEHFQVGPTEVTILPSATTPALHVLFHRGSSQRLQAARLTRCR